MVGFRILRLIESKVKKESLPLATNLARVEVGWQTKQTSLQYYVQESFTAHAPSKIQLQEKQNLNNLSEKDLR